MSEADQVGAAETAPMEVSEPVFDVPVEAPASGGLAGGGKKDKIRPFRKRSVEWLKKEAKIRGMSGYSKKKKDELVEMLKGSKPPPKGFQAPQQTA